MSKIDEQIQKLREQEKTLKREKKKVEFFRHILASAKDYELKEFSEVKDEVVQKLELFVEKVVEAIESGEELIIKTGPDWSNWNKPEASTKSEEKEETKEEPKLQNKPDSDEVPELSPQEKMSFALQHRHLAKKKVTVTGSDGESVTGEVVGLDAPFVVVKTKTGPTIKVPLEKISV